MKNRTCYYFDGIINIYDLDLDNIWFDEKSFEKIWIYHVTYKAPYLAKHHTLYYSLIKLMDILENMIELNV